MHQYYRERCNGRKGVAGLNSLMGFSGLRGVGCCAAQADKAGAERQQDSIVAGAYEAFPDAPESTQH